MYNILDAVLDDPRDRTHAVASSDWRIIEFKGRSRSFWERALEAWRSWNSVYTHTSSSASYVSWTIDGDEFAIIQIDHDGFVACTQNMLIILLGGITTRVPEASVRVLILADKDEFREGILGKPRYNGGRGASDKSEGVVDF